MQESGQLSDSKRKRRKRTDDDGRTFTCKCGKSYLSYPALYTHIKTKHSDEPLSRLTRAYQGLDSSLNYPQRMQRSQVERQKQHIKQKQKQRQKQKQKDKQYEDNYPLYGNSLPQVNNIEVLKQFLFKYFPNIVVNTNQNYKHQMTILEKKQLKEMKDYWLNGRRKQDEPFNQVYETPIRFVMGKFLLQLQSQVQNISFRKFLFIFAFAIKKAIQKIKEDQNYFKNNNAAELPMLFDQILREHFLLIDNNDFLSNPTVAAKVLYHFGRWLYVNKFTNLSLKYNF